MSDFLVFFKIGLRLIFWYFEEVESWLEKKGG